MPDWTVFCKKAVKWKNSLSLRMQWFHRLCAGVTSVLLSAQECHRILDRQWANTRSVFYWQQPLLNFLSISVSSKMIVPPQSSTHSLLISTLESALPSIERTDALITCVIWCLSSEWDTTGGEWGGGAPFNGFSKVKVGERVENAGPAQWSFIWMGQAVQAIKLSAKRGHYWFCHGGLRGLYLLLFYFISKQQFDLIERRCSIVRATQSSDDYSLFKEHLIIVLRGLLSSYQHPFGPAVSIVYILLYELFPWR